MQPYSSVNLVKLDKASGKAPVKLLALRTLHSEAKRALTYEEPIELKAP